MLFPERIPRGFAAWGRALIGWIRFPHHVQPRNDRGLAGIQHPGPELVVYFWEAGKGHPPVPFLDRQCPHHRILAGFDHDAQVPWMEGADVECHQGTTRVEVCICLFRGSRVKTLIEYNVGCQLSTIRVVRPLLSTGKTTDRVWQSRLSPLDRAP